MVLPNHVCHSALPRPEFCANIATALPAETHQPKPKKTEAGGGQQRPPRRQLFPRPAAVPRRMKGMMGAVPGRTAAWFEPEDAGIRDAGEWRCSTRSGACSVNQGATLATQPGAKIINECRSESVLFGGFGGRHPPRCQQRRRGRQGYAREQVLGRNCRFLRGAGTDRKGVDAMRTAVENGTDATACLLNYKADGTPFWNQMFAAAMRDADNCFVNYVGVRTMIKPNAGASALEDEVNAAHPISAGVDGEDNNIIDNTKDAKE